MNSKTRNLYTLTRQTETEIERERTKIRTLCNLCKIVLKTAINQWTKWKETAKKKTILKVLQSYDSAGVVGSIRHERIIYRWDTHKHSIQATIRQRRDFELLMPLLVVLVMLLTQ